MSTTIQKDPYARSSKYELGLTIMMFFTVGMIMLDKQLPLYLGSYLMQDLNITNA